MKRRRIERRKMEEITRTVVSGRPLEPELRRQQISRPNYEAWVRNHQAYVSPDDGKMNVWFGRAILASVVLCVLGAAMQWKVLPCIAVLTFGLALLGHCLDSLWRGVLGNWNTSEVVRYDQQPVGFMIGIVFMTGVDLVFVTGGVTMVVRWFSGDAPN